MPRKVARLIATTILLLFPFLIEFCPGTIANAQVPSELESASIEGDASKEGILPEFSEVRSEMQRLRSQLDAQNEAQETIVLYLQIVTAWLVLISLLALALQFMAFRADSAIRRRHQEETATYKEREDALNNRLVQVLEVTSRSAEQAQRMVSTVEEGGIKRAAETLQLINNLLAITERAAAKASEAEFEFLLSLIDSLDHECQRLTSEATREDERDIIAKPEFIERVRILAEQVNSLDHQITAFNRTVPRQLRQGRGTEQSAVGSTNNQGGSWSGLRLTGPCLFIRGLNHHVHQNFRAAIDAWKAALNSVNASAVFVDANYWIGYLNNTLGEFDEAMSYIRNASEEAAEHRRPELTRLLLETRFFALGPDLVPDELLEEGRARFRSLNSGEVSKRAISSFATTMGNLSMIQQIRGAGEKANLNESTKWFEAAVQAEKRSRWARFGLCQNFVLSGAPVDDHIRSELEDVIGSVEREYQSREEDRSKALSKVTQYMCMLMLGGHNEPEKREIMSTIAGQVEMHTGKVTARTLYSQFRKQNIEKSDFIGEFKALRETRDFRKTFFWANGIEV